MTKVDPCGSGLASPGPATASSPCPTSPTPALAAHLPVFRVVCACTFEVLYVLGERDCDGEVSRCQG